MMVAQYLRAQAWWRLDCPGVSANRVARSVVALLLEAAATEVLPENHPDLEELARAGWFRGGAFDPGEAGRAVVRGWELADQPTGEQDLLATLATLAGTTTAAVGARFPEPVHHEAPHAALPYRAHAWDANSQQPL